MPILPREADIYPDDLLDDPDLDARSEARWLVLYTRSRQEKELMRRLRVLETSFYCPIIAKKSRSPQGRVRTAHVPLFSNYVFIHGDDERRYAALTTNCVSRWLEVTDGKRLTADLRAIYRLIASGEPVTQESKLQKGARVRILSGPLAGFEGIVIERDRKKRLLVAVDFLQRGASVLLEDYQLEPIA